MSDTIERVEKIVVKLLSVTDGKVTEDMSFVKDLGADSLDVIELVMAFERDFGIDISNKAAEEILTVGDAVRFIESRFANSLG